MADYYMVMSDGVTDGTATGTKGKYSQAEYDGIGADGFANALSNDWATKGHGTLNEYYYPDIVSAITAGAGAGDYILCAHTHNYSEVLSALLEFSPGTYSGVFLTIRSVDVTDITTYKKGATETRTGAYNFRFNGYAHSVGVNYTFEWEADNYGMWIIEDCTITQTRASYESITAAGDGSAFIFRDVDISGPNASQAAIIRCSGGGTIDWRGGKRIGRTSDNTFLQVSNAGFQGGGGSITLSGVDLSEGTTNIIGNTGDDRAVDDAIDYTVRNCKMNAALTSPSGHDFESLNQRVSLFNCGSTSAEAEYQFHIVAFGGEVEDETSIIRQESTAFPSGQKVSAHVTTVGNVSKGTPFSFELPARYAEFTQYDKIRIYIASTSTLYTDKVWAELIYRDGTNNHTPHRLDSKPDDFLAASVELDVDTGSNWKSAGVDYTGNEYMITLDVEANDPGADCVPTIILHVGEAAATELYIDTSVEMIA